MPRGVSGLHEEPEMDAKAAAWAALEALVKDDVKAVCAERGLASNEAATKQELIRLAVSDGLRAADLSLGQLHRIAAHGTNAVAWFKTMRRAELLAIVAAFGLPVDIKAKALADLIIKELAKDQYRFAAQRARSSFQHALEAQLALHDEEKAATAGCASVAVDATAYLAALSLDDAFGNAGKAVEILQPACTDLAKYVDKHFSKHSAAVIKILAHVHQLATRRVPADVLGNTVRTICMSSPAEAVQQAQNACALMLGT